MHNYNVTTVARVHQAISRCCFAEDVTEMYKDLNHTCTAVVWLIRPLVWWSSPGRRPSQKNRCSRNKIFLKLPILSSTETYSPLNKIGCVNRQIPGDVSKTNVLKDEKNTEFLVFSTWTKWPCLFVKISKNLILRHYTLWALAIYIVWKQNLFLTQQCTTHL